MTANDKCFVISIWATFINTIVVKTLRGVSTPPAATCMANMQDDVVTLQTKNIASFITR